MVFSIRDYPLGEKLIFENNQIRIARSPYRITLPLQYSPDLAYLAGYHLGDGYLEDYTKKFQKNNKGSFEVVYADEYKSQIEQVIASIIKTELGVDLHIQKKKSELWVGRLNCKIVHMFLHQILEMPIGKKLNLLVPSYIAGNKELLRHFISGFFDAEGSIFRDKFNKVGMTLTNTDYDFLSTIKEILNNYFEIEFGPLHKKHHQNAFEMKTGSKEVILRFCNKIGFRHPYKLEKMKECIERLNQIRSRKHIKPVSIL